MTDIAECIFESDLDTMELALRKQIENYISQGDLVAAEATEEAMKNLDRVEVCSEEIDKTKGFAVMMRDRARYL